MPHPQPRFTRWVDAAAQALGSGLRFRAVVALGFREERLDRAVDVRELGVRRRAAPREPRRIVEVLTRRQEVRVVPHRVPDLLPTGEDLDDPAGFAGRRATTDAELADVDRAIEAFLAEAEGDDGTEPKA